MNAAAASVPLLPSRGTDDYVKDDVMDRLQLVHYIAGAPAGDPLVAELDALFRQRTGTESVAAHAPEFTFRGPWFTSREAMAYIPCRSLKSFYSWCRLHFIVRRSNGSVAKADIDRALKARRLPRRVNPKSLENLKRRHRKNSDRE